MSVENYVFLTCFFQTPSWSWCPVLVGWGGAVEQFPSKPRRQGRDPRRPVHRSRRPRLLRPNPLHGRLCDTHCWMVSGHLNLYLISTWLTRLTWGLSRLTLAWGDVVVCHHNWVSGSSCCAPSLYLWRIKSSQSSSASSSAVSPKVDSMESVPTMKNVDSCIAPTLRIRQEASPSQLWYRCYLPASGCNTLFWLVRAENFQF